MTGEDAAATGSEAVDAAVARLRAVAAEAGTAGPGEAGSADAAVLRTALATLPYQEQRLLWDSHVLGRSVDGIAGALGLHVRAARRRLRRAEEQLARALSAAHARGVPERLCAETRGDLHAYVAHHLGGGRRQALEEHLFGCSGCMRAFIDVRQASWALRDAAPVLVAPLAAGGVGVPVVVGALGASTHTGAAGWFAALGAAVAGAWEWVVRGVRQVVGRPVGLAAGAAGALVAVAAVAMGLAAGSGSAPAVPVAVASPSATAAPTAAPVTTPTPAASPSASAEAEPEAPTSPEPTPEPSAPGVPAVVGAPDPTDETPAASEDPPPDDERVPARGEDRDDAETPPRSGRSADGRADSPAPAATGTPGAVPSAAPPTTEPVAPPSAAPSPSAVPPPEPEPSAAAEPVSASTTLTVGGFGWFLVVPTGGAEVVDVVGGRRTEVTQDQQGRWWVRAVGSREREVTVVVTGPAGSAPGARLSWFGVER